MLTASRPRVEEGDTVVLYFDHSTVQALVVHRGEQLQCKAGIFSHDAIIGTRYGTRVHGRPQSKQDNHVPTVVVLRLTPELWTRCLRHRTQILYMTDIALIGLHLRLRPGSIVAEAGTGSGSLTHSLARSVSPDGMVYTFDFHEQRADEARAEFHAHGLSHVVTVAWRDVCRDDPVLLPADASSPAAPTEHAAGLAPSGYGLPPHSVDAIFLDVPSPWLAIRNALHVLRPGGAICSFSPCIEQTQRFCAGLRESDEFLDIHTVESLTREYIPAYPTRQPEPVLKRPRVEARPEAAEGEGGEHPLVDPNHSAASPQTPNHHRRALFRPRAEGKGHSAFLTFARRRVYPTDTDDPRNLGSGNRSAAADSAPTLPSAVNAA